MSELLRVEDIAVHFPVKDIFSQKLFSIKREYVRAVDGISFTVQKGETVAIVGESGCGKSTVGRALVGLTPLTKGKVTFNGMDITYGGNLPRIRKQAQFIFQDPFSSLNPRMKVKEILTRPMRIHGTCGSKEEMNSKLEALLQMVGLNKEQSLRFPHEFSGGQKQRISIARMLAVEPDFVIADEPTAALDVSIQAQILNLLISLKESLNLTMLFISHDLGVVEYISDRVIVMYLGKIVEIGSTKDIIQNPLHPYTKALLAAVPINPTQKKGEEFKLSGNIPSPINLPKGCRLHPRCMYSTEKCMEIDDIDLKKVSENREVACILCN